jgi:hypothetical protein
LVVRSWLQINSFKKLTAWRAPHSRLRSRRSLAGRFMILSGTRVVRRQPEGDLVERLSTKQTNNK